MGRFTALLALLVLGLYTLHLTGCDGKAEPLSTGDYLGDPTIEDGGSRSDIDPGQLYNVTKIVEATSDIPSWVDADLPFNRPRRQLGQSFTDSQWPFEFNYTYPANNYALTEAHMLLVTSRDSSDTEAIFIDGVFTGRPPDTMVSTTSTKVTHRLYNCRNTECGGAIAPTGPANTYFLDWALNHYKVATENTFDINLSNLLTNTALTITDILSDGVFHVVSGDDAIVQTDTATASRPLLVMSGSTYSTAALTCSTSPTYKMKNTYLHVDGNSIAEAAFSGTVLTPFDSWSVVYSTFRSVEFYFDPLLPKLPAYDMMNITRAEISLQIRRANTDPTAIVINGIGIDQTGFDRTPATSAVEEWTTDTSIISAWDTFVASVPADGNSYTRTLNLLTLLGANTVKTLLLQGKLNISVAGPIARVSGQAATSTRTYGVQVAGPELILEGNYATQICEVPDNPNSPIGGGDTGPVDCLADTAGPVSSSVGAINVTSSSATIQWLTNEAATTRIAYGLTTPPSTLTTEDTNLVTFHTVNITGLQPYKFYQFNVRSKDSCGNETISSTKSFRTLR